MAIKNLGHYEGVVEDLKPTEFNKLHILHRSLINLNKEKEILTNKLKEIDEKIKEIKEKIKPDVEKGKIKWAWVWYLNQTRVKWKEEFVKFLGIKKAQEVTETYQKKTYPQIGIQYVDPILDTIVQIKENPPKFKTNKIKLKSKK